MKTKLKRLLVFVCSLIMALCLFVGCSPVDSNSSTAAGTGTEQTDGGSADAGTNTEQTDTGSGTGNDTSTDNSTGNTQNDTNSNNNTSADTAGNTADKTFKVTTEVKDGYTTKTSGGETVYTFTKAGEYTLSGELSGRIVVGEGEADSVVVFNLNGCKITTAYAAVTCEYEEPTIEIKSNENTENTITVSGSGDNSAIDLEGDVELGGKGKLTITAGQKHAISASNVKFKGNSTINIIDKKDGVNAKKLEVKGSTTTIAAGDDGIQIEVTKKGKKGTIDIVGGTLTVKDCAGKGIKAENAITVSNGVLNITGCDVGIVAEFKPNKNVTVDTFVHELKVEADGTVNVSGCTTSSITCAVKNNGGTVTVNGQPYTAA